MIVVDLEGIHPAFVAAIVRRRRSHDGWTVPLLTRRVLDAVRRWTGLQAIASTACPAAATMTSPAAAASGGAEKASGTVSFGSNASDPVPKGALQEVFDAFQTSSGITVDVNTVDHNTFQEQINNYLQGTPGRRVHLVRRLPHAVLRRARPGDRHQRRLGEDRRQLLGGVQGGLDGLRRQAVLHPVLQLPVGGLLQEERLGEERLRAGREPGRLQGARASRSRRTA